MKPEFDPEKDKQEASKIDDEQERIMFIRERVKEFELLPAYEQLSINLGFGLMSGKSYPGIMNLEIEFIKNTYKDKMEFEQSQPQQSKKDTDKIIFTYKWQSNPETELPKFYNKMKGNFIAEDTDKNNFKNIFLGVPVNEIKKIQWTHKQKNLLAYFIDKLRTENKISIATDIWAIAKYCFSPATNLKQLKDLYTNNKSEKPKNYFLIDTLFETL